MAGCVRSEERSGFREHSDGTGHPSRRNGRLSYLPHRVLMAWRIEPVIEAHTSHQLSSSVRCLNEGRLGSGRSIMGE